jgi:hypothetical protein
MRVKWLPEGGVGVVAARGRAGNTTMVAERARQGIAGWASAATRAEGCTDQSEDLSGRDARHTGYGGHWVDAARQTRGRC